MDQDIGLSTHKEQSNLKSDQLASAQSPHAPLPGIELPRGGGAIKSIDENFQVNAVNGTNGTSVGLPYRGSRGFGLGLSLGYNSGMGDSAFGLGWNVSIPSIKRQSDKKLPRYDDSDHFMVAGGDELVPLLEQNSVSGNWQAKTRDEISHRVELFRTRIEASWQRIEKWIAKADGQIHWRVISSDNIVSVFGYTVNARLSDPADPIGRIYEWKLSHNFDDKGNLVCYQYKHEDFVNVMPTLSERNRNPQNCTNCYIKRVLQGNKTPYFRGNPLPSDEDFLFQTVFDYGEHDVDFPGLNESINWPVRDHPFSSFRAGFDIRTYRLCRRVLLFHRFEELPIDPYLVMSTDFTFSSIPEDDLPEDYITTEGNTFLRSILQKGYRYDEVSNTYSVQETPPVAYQYQSHQWSDEIHSVTDDDLTGAPRGIDGQEYRWMDLYGEGLSGILKESQGTLYYKENLGQGEFTPASALKEQPSFAGLELGELVLQNLDGTGQPALVHWKEPVGFFQQDNFEWQPFVLLAKSPSYERLNMSNARLIDLTGDGQVDVLITDDEFFEWHPSLGTQGFGEPNRLSKALDEEAGPRIVFQDPKELFLTADISGDGLTDLVRIRNGEICYWANLGYGKFSHKLSMFNAPRFDTDDKFNTQLLRFADIDGSGNTDMIYLGRSRFDFWLNLKGNGWSARHQLDAFPAIDNLSDVEVLDLLGSGTACVAWSSGLPGDARSPLKYIDIMESKKPHLLKSAINNQGRKAFFEYQPSTYFYLKDKLNGQPWATRLPFPVHVVTKIIIVDYIRNTRYTQQYSYHHGYFDAKDREFRGFGRVEVEDTEDFKSFSVTGASNVVEETHHQPPSKTITWYHTGAFSHRALLEEIYSDEFFDDHSAGGFRLSSSVMPPDLSITEWQESQRAFKGSVLRQEIYSRDGSLLQGIPYSTAEKRYKVRKVQPEQKGYEAVFQVLGLESIAHNYERRPGDPKVTQSMVLVHDDRGIPLRSASVNYPRQVRPPDLSNEIWALQNQGHVTINEHDLTSDIDTANNFRFRVPYETRQFELLGFTVGSSLVMTTDVANFFTSASSISFETDGDGTLQKRLFSHERRYFLGNDFSSLLSLGERESLSLAHHSEQLAFTQGLVTKHYSGKVDSAMLLDAGYVHSEGDSDWWVRSGTLIYGADPVSRFFMPEGQRDIFGRESWVGFDQYLLLIENETNTLGQSTSAKNDYRTLTSYEVIDENLNRSQVETDVLGCVVKKAIMGKAGAGEGDTLADPTAIMEYDLFNWMNHQKPNWVRARVREEHANPASNWQESVSHFDGSGGLILTKRQVEPGEAKRWDSVSQSVESVTTNDRWIGNGRTIINNKGMPIKAFDPYFSTHSGFEDEAALVETGVSSVSYFDPMGRVIRNELPDGTFTKTEFDIWQVRAFDVIDTVQDSDWYSSRGSPDPILDPEPGDPEARAAWLSAKFHNTPSITHFDSLRRSVINFTDHGDGKITQVRNEMDLLGRYSRVFDELDREVSYGVTNLIGVPIFGESAEKGTSWLFNDAMGRLYRLWDNNDREFYATYDDLNRPVSAIVKQDGIETTHTHHVYGDGLPDAIDRNMVGQVYQVYDQAGVTSIERNDFKLNPLSINKQLTHNYDSLTDWSSLSGITDIAAITAAAAPQLESETFHGSVIYDALNRPTRSVLADGTVLLPIYNRANNLDQLQAQLGGVGPFRTFLQSQQHNVHGMREKAEFGNGAVSEYSYDPDNFRLTRLLTRSHSADHPAQSLQDVRYFYDAIGNVVEWRDLAQQTHYFNNSVVNASAKFEYDAIHQLIKATGREHAGIGSGSQSTDLDLPYIPQLPHANDSNAVRNYTEHYSYDDVGNISSIQHHTGSGTGNWHRRYQYAYQNSPGDRTNRLVATSVPGDPVTGPYSDRYHYDLRGNMTSMPHLPSLQWNAMNQLSQIPLGGGGIAFYVYGASGTRRRKVIRRNGGQRVERIYLGGNEIYREYNSAGDKTFERWTTFISDGEGNIAQIDTKVLDTQNIDVVNPLDVPLIRYQHSNLLGSINIETDENAQVISYEDFHPFGTSAYRSSHSSADLSLKRYRFSGKERDDETGFYYFGARYYAAWLGRWTSSDPAGFADGTNLYRYARNNPINLGDANGTYPTLVQGSEQLDNPDPPPEAYSEDRNTAVEHYNSMTWRGTAQFELEDGSRVTLAFTYRIRVTGVERVTQSNVAEAGEYAGKQFWSITERTVVPGSVQWTNPNEGDGAGGEGNGEGDGDGDGDAQGQSQGAGPGPAATGVGGAVIRNNPEGRVLGVPPDVEGDKLGRLQEHTRQRLAGRNTGPANPTRARRNTPQQRAALAEFRERMGYPGGQQPAGTAAGHRVDMQYDLSNEMGNHWRDYIEEGRARNSDDGLDGYRRMNQQGHQQGEPFGAVARDGQTRFWQTERFRARMRVGGAVLTGVGTVFSGYGLYQDIMAGDVYMGIGDAMGVAGGGLELYSLTGGMTTGGATVGGLSALGLGITLSGAAIAVTSGVSGYRAYQRGDTAGAIAGGVGVVGGTMMAAGGAIATASAAGVAMAPALVAAAPVLIAAGAVLALGVGIYHAGDYFGWW